MRIYEFLAMAGWQQMTDAVVPVVQGLVSLGMLVATLGGMGLALYHLFASPSPREQIRDWCEDHRVRLVEMERRYLRAGPFFFSPNGTMVFYVTVRDEFGFEKFYWMRCGRGLIGSWMYGLQVQRDD